MSSTTASQLAFFAPATVSTDDTTASIGGAITTNQITNNSANAWMSPLVANYSGTVGVDTQVEYGTFYLSNTNPATDGTGGVQNLGFYLGNGINNTIVSGAGAFVSMASSSDTDSIGSGLVVTYYYATTSNALTVVTTPINGTTTLTSNLTDLSKMLRITVTNAAGVPTPPTGVLSFYMGTSPSPTAKFAEIRPVEGSNPGMTCATGEFSFAAYGSLGNQGTFANRRTDPGAGALTYTFPNTPGTMIYLTGVPGATITPGQFGCIAGKFALEPGMAPMLNEDLQLVAYGFAL